VSNALASESSTLAAPMQVKFSDARKLSGTRRVVL